MYVTRTYRIKGLAPTMMHNGRLVNPLDPIVKEHAKLTAKRKKSDEDHEEIARLEFLGALYMSTNGKQKSRPCWPSENIHAMLVEAAKSERLGKVFTGSILVAGEFPLDYNGPTDPEKLWAKEEFRDTRKVGIQQSSLMRTRPIFREWELVFEVQYLSDKLEPETVDRIVEYAGQHVGLSDYRPRFGRFELLEAV